MDLQWLSKVACEACATTRHRSGTMDRIFFLTSVHDLKVDFSLCNRLLLRWPRGLGFGAFSRLDFLISFQVVCGCL